MDMNSDSINFTKIKDGFFLGDESIASNLEVLLQFKISHMINAAGAQVINAWESIGIRYLTLNWSENTSQILFDQKDEIANKIVEFIDEALRTGEGLLIHSIKGQNRACIVVLIYLMRKFRWTLTKAIEFMNNKKFDMEIQKHFLNQLFLFETRLNKNGIGAKSSSFSEMTNQQDKDEVLITNTYLNGLENKIPSRPYTSDYRTGSKNRKISWADNGDFTRKDMLCSINPQKELLYLKEIKPVTNHKKMYPVKSSMKRKNNSSQGSRSPYKDRNAELQNLINIGSHNNPNSGFVPVKGQNSNSLNNSHNLNEKENSLSYNKNSKLINDQNANRLINNSSIGNYPNLGIGKNLNNSVNKTNNSFLKQSNDNYNVNSSQQIKSNYQHGNSNRPNSTPQNNPNQRSFSYDQKERNQNTNSNNQKNDVMKIIISPQVQNVYNQNVNNIYIQNPQYDPNRQNQQNTNTQNNINRVNYNSYQNPSNTINRPNSVTKKDSRYSLNDSSKQNNRPQTRPDNSNFVRSNDSQKYMQNNYFSNQNALDNKNMRVIDHNSNINNKKPTNKNAFNQNVSSYNSLNNYSKNIGQNQMSVNNYKPELNKKNNHPTNISSSLLNRSNNQQNVPIRLHNDYEKKPMTPDPSNYQKNSISNLKSYKPNQPKPMMSSLHNQQSVIKRSNSFKKTVSNERPSTAPQKEREEKNHGSSLNMKRVPSPFLKSSSGLLGNTMKPSGSSNYQSALSPNQGGRSGMTQKLGGSLNLGQPKSYSQKNRRK